MKLSIIIPVYNVEEYIRKCLESCVNQTFNTADYEIIVVNDGTPDGSVKIINEYVEKYENIVLINQENKGLSAARNTGLRYAKGDYVWFVDSDDWIDSMSLEILWPYLNRFDIICQRSFFRNYSSAENIIDYKGEFRQGKDIVFNNYDSKAQLYLYNKDYLKSNAISFKNGIYHEDMHFTPRALYMAASVICIQSPLYHYRLRDNSISTTVAPKRILDLMDTCNDLLEFSRLHIKIDDISSWYRTVILRTLIQILSLNRHIEDKNVHTSVKKYINSHREFSYCFRLSGNIKMKMIGCLSMLVGCKLYQVYNFILGLKK